MRQEHARRYTCWMVLMACLGLSLLGLAAMVAAQDTPSGDPSFIPPGAKLEMLVKGDDQGIVFTEGAAAGCDGKVYFSSGPLDWPPLGAPSSHMPLRCQTTCRPDHRLLTMLIFTPHLNRHPRCLPLTGFVYHRTMHREGIIGIDRLDKLH